MQALADGARERFGKIDVLVCNAALNPHFGPSQEIPDEAFDKVMHANIGSIHRLCRMVLPGMAENGGGSVIIVSSIAGLRGSNVLGAYAISKAADMQIARNLAIEWGPRNIRPAIGQPLGEPDEIAGAAVYFASSAGNFTTGQTLVVDGGGTA